MSRGRSRRAGQPRQRRQRGRSRVGERFEVEVGPIAHGGFCVARVDGRAVFVRHALPGERVTVQVTEGGDDDRFWRADAVEVLAASPARVAPPCPISGPNGCGGCDFQHVDVAAQRGLKAQVVVEQFRRLADLSVEVEVEQVPGDSDGLRWRTRQRYATLPDGRPAMRKHRSHELIAVDDCLIDAHRPPSYEVRGVAFEVADDGFWQVHPGAPEVLLAAVLDGLTAQPGETVLDLYSGVGLFARFLGEAVGAGASGGRAGRGTSPSVETSDAVVAVEADRAALAPAQRNLDGWAHAVCDDVGRYLAGDAAAVDLVVLDPPRAGAKRAVVEGVVARHPRAVAYVACDPAALARDVAIFGEHEYEMTSLRAFDLFPMTHHVECVAVLARTSPGRH